MGGFDVDFEDNTIILSTIDNKPIEETLPKRAQEFVTEWLKQNQKELQEMWDNQKIYKLPPL